MWFGQLLDGGQLTHEDEPYVEALRAAIAKARGE
jgi:hypothetical protein